MTQRQELDVTYAIWGVDITGKIVLRALDDESVMLFIEREGARNCATTQQGNKDRCGLMLNRNDLTKLRSMIDQMLGEAA